MRLGRGQGGPFPLKFKFLRSQSKIASPIDTGAKLVSTTTSTNFNLKSKARGRFEMRIRFTGTTLNGVVRDSNTTSGGSSTISSRR